MRGVIRGLGLAVVCAVPLVTAGCVELDERPTTWSYVYATIIHPNCTTANCHSAPTATAGLQFHTKESAYTFLTGRLCEPMDGAPEPDHNLVVPGNPAASKLIWQLRGEGVRNMPPDVPLPEVEIELIERWITEGAECN